MDIDLDDEVVKFFSKKNQSSIFGDSDFVEMIKEKCVRKDKEFILEMKEKLK
ncbi:MAG: hypothetical protein GY941_25395 [Planctomycetes bacterium]|nr:hypothetical protein [Planctomycetota bacterium]